MEKIKKVDYLKPYIFVGYTILQVFIKKNNAQDILCIMNLLKHITKERDPIRQIYYTKKEPDW